MKPNQRKILRRRDTRDQKSQKLDIKKKPVSIGPAKTLRRTEGGRSEEGENDRFTPAQTPHRKKVEGVDMVEQGEKVSAGREAVVRARGGISLETTSKSAGRIKGPKEVFREEKF